MFMFVLNSGQSVISTFAQHVSSKTTLVTDEDQRLTNKQLEDIDMKLVESA